MVNAVEVILVPTLIIIVGILLKKLKILRQEDSSLLSKLVINVCLPSLIFTNIAKANISGEMIYLPIISIGVSLICMFIAYCYSRIMSYSKVKTWSIILLLSLMNTAFIGYPVVLGVYGNEGFLYAIFYDLAIVIMLVFFGMILSTIFGGNRKQVIKDGLSFVPLWAVVFGLIFNVCNIPLGYVLDSSLTYLGQATIPLIMLSLALTLNLKSFKSYLSDTIFVSTFRLLIVPIVLYLFLVTLGFGGYLLNVSVLQSAMPTAMTVLVLAITYDLDVELVSSIVFIDTTLAVFSLPLIINFLLAF